MIRGIRGATTVTENTEAEILENTKTLVKEMAEKNNIEADMISHVFISATNDLDTTFPAKSLRQIPGWKYVPVMCMAEIDVLGSLSKCIRVMMIANTSSAQDNIQHIFHNEAIKLRPDLVREVR